MSRGIKRQRVILQGCSLLQRKPPTVLKNEIIGMKLYAETERAMEKALQDACTLYHCEEDMMVVIPDQGK